MANVIVIMILVIVLGAAIRYIYKAKKNGAACIGCPHSGTCSSCGCHTKGQPQQMGAGKEKRNK